MNSPGVAERSARRVVDAVRAAASHRITVAVIGLILTVVIALGYVVFGSLRVNPARSTIAVNVLLPESGGLLAQQDVTLRGVPIGRVASVQLTGRGVTAVADVDSGVLVPKDSTVRVSGLSPAGEQYLDFRPDSDRGPYLGDGDTIGEDRGSVPVPFSELVSNAEGALNQLDPDKIAAITSELGVGPQSPEKLAALIDGGTFLISTLDSVLPQTVRVLRNSRAVLTLLADVGPGLTDTSQNLRATLAGVNRMDGGYRRLLDTGRAPLTQLDHILADNSDTMVALLGNLTTIAQLSYVRLPALNALFPGTDQRGSALDALASVIHDDGGIWVIGDIYPRYTCDYDLPRHPPTQADLPEPYRYTYCANPDPSVLPRGARNAPRPPGDDTAGPPPGYNPLATTDPAPVGPNTIPTPYGGPPPDHDPQK
jgi:virulence factor Mce-like protein